MDDDEPYEVAITRVCDSGDIPDEPLAAAVKAALHHFHVARASIGVAVVSDAHIEELNQRHLGHNGPTDVLTFDLRDESVAPPRVKSEINGEIVVSVDTARREAVARQHSLIAEISLYLVHGTLHLLGYDDDAPKKAAQMHKLEDEVLSSIGMGRVYGRSAL